MELKIFFNGIDLGVIVKPLKWITSFFYLLCSHLSCPCHHEVCTMSLHSYIWLLTVPILRRVELMIKKKNSKHLKFHWNLSSLKIGKQKWKPWPELLLSLFTSFCIVVVPLIFSFSCMAEVWSHFMDFVFPSKNSTSWITLVGKWVTSRGVFSTKC